MNRLVSVGELRAVAIKHLVELSIEHEFFCHFFSKRNLSCSRPEPDVEGDRTLRVCPSIQPASWEHMFQET